MSGPARERASSSESDLAAERRERLARALKRYRTRLARKVEALEGDLAFARRASEFRQAGTALLAYLTHVSPRAREAKIPDPADPSRTLRIELDPGVPAQVNAARYFKRAAKAERASREVPPRLAAAEDELRALDALLGRTVREPDETVALDRDLERSFAALPASVRQAIAPGLEPVAPSRTPGAPPRRDGSATADRGTRTEERAPSARLQPRRLRTREGWDVLICRNNEGNDYLTHRLARPEDYWFHVHGASGSHVVLRRGKGRNEPSRRTIEEVAAWTAFYSQARTAGKVPVIFTRKKYVRKPRKAAPGLVTCEREKSVMVKPAEPPAAASARVEEPEA